MQLRSIRLAALIALFASSATSFTSNVPMLSPMRVLAQSTETHNFEAERLLDLCREDIKKNQDQAALQSCQLAVTTAQAMGLRSTQAKSLSNLGKAYQNTGNLKQALNEYQQALFIAQAIKERATISKVLLNMGEVANKLGDTAKAKALFQQALAIAQEIKDPQLVSLAQAQIQNKPEKVEADKLLAQGTKQLDTSQFQAALGSYQQALKVYQSIKERQGEAYSLGNLGLAYYSLGDYKRAIDYHNQGLVIAKEIGDRQWEARSLGNLGLAYYSLGDYKRAIDYHNQGLVIAKEIGDRQWEARSLGNLGLAYYSLGDYKRAIDYHNQGLVIAKEIGDRQWEARSLGNLGLAYYSLGDYKRAIDYHNQGLVIAKEIGDRQWEARSLGNLGLAYNSLGDYKRAIDYHNQGLVIAKEIGDRQGEARSLGNLGLAYYSLGDYKRAIDYHNQGLVIAKVIGDRQGEARSLGNLGLAYYSLGDYKRAIDYHNQGLVIAKEIGDRQWEARSLGNLGLAYNSLGDYKRAIDYHNQGLAIAKAIGDRQSEAISLNNLGLAQIYSGNPKAAEESLHKAIAVKESIRKDLGRNDAFKVSIFETQASSYRLLQQALVAQNRTIDALLVAEQGRAKAFIELLAQHQQLSSTPEPLNIAQIRQIAKQQNATLVEYSITSHNLYIWVVKPTGEVAFQKVDLLKMNLGVAAEDTRTAAATLAEGHGVANDVITGLVSKTRSTLRTTNSASSVDTLNAVRSVGCRDRGNNCLQQMYQLLIQPIAKQLPTNPDSRVIFIPHQSLFLVPFAALQDSNHKFLIETHTISIAPSIQVLELIHQQKLKLQSRQTALQNSLRVGISGNALIVGNPTMPSVPPKIGEAPQPLDPLPGAQKEANIIAKLLNTQALTGNQATLALVKQRLPRAKIIHLATHGLLDDLGEEGIPGAVALAPSNGDDGLLSANELLNLKLNADLVVLSACDTGRGRITGDGVIGLPRAFISAGVPSIVVSLWRLPDESTAFLMPEFYRQLKNNPDKAHALRQAMLATMKKYPNPSDWAAFIFIGEPD